jgi:hypothetical protein
MSDIAQQALEALLSGAKGAAAGSVGGPIGAAAGGLIGLASSLVPHVFGEDAKPALQAVAQAITGATDEAAQVEVLSSDPAAIAQFKVQALQIAADREAAQLNAQNDEITARLADVANARQQTVQLAQAGSGLSWGAPVVSVIVAVGFFAAFAALMWVRAIEDAGVSAMVNMMVGGLVSALTTVLSYWLGSSAGSRRKTDMLAAGVKAAPEPNMASEAAR